MNAAPLLYYDASGAYWVEACAGNYLQVDKSSAKLHLRAGGLSKDEYVGNLNQLENALLLAQKERSLDYAGPLSGHAPGVFRTSDGRRALVTSGTRIIKAEPGEFPAFHKFTFELLGAVQQERLFGWLKAARDAQAAGDFRPGQLLALAGPSGCGKSLLQALIGEWLGGRTAKPFRYMMGETPFNGDLAGAEHWCIEDENSSTDMRQRRRFGAALKEAVVNREFSIHPKNKQAFTLPTFRRVTLSTNDEEENLAILPPLDGSMLDKIMLLKCSPAKVGTNRKATWSKLTGELPALAAELDGWKIPKRIQDSRYGVEAFHHPDLIECLTSLSPEERLRNLIDSVLFANRREPWKGSSAELERDLRNSSFGFAVDKLLSWSGACGVFLARLANIYPARITRHRDACGVHWTIGKPPVVI